MSFLKKKTEDLSTENEVTSATETEGAERKEANEFLVERNMIAYDVLLPKVQTYMSSQYATAVFDMDRTEMFKNHIKQYIIDNNYYVEGKSLKQTVDMLYSDMAEFSILTPYLNRSDIEEININAWNDIQIIPSNGSPYKSAETFKSPEHCVDIIRRILHQNGSGSFDSSNPIAKSFLDKNKRITAVYNCIVDKECGASASIRIVNPRLLSKLDFIKSGTCNEEMYNLLSICFNYGVSECFAGETGSGKTTIMSDIMRNYPDDKRLITIESETREFNLVRKNEEGKILNNVIHMITRDSDDEKKKITQIDLLTVSLTMNPDALCMAEIKYSGEAWGAQEAARTGHAVMATTHASSTDGIYTRLATLCVEEHSNIPYEVILRLVSDAFPIAVYQTKFEDGVRRITEISECIHDGEKIRMNPLWRYQKKKQETDKEGNVKVIGDFVRINPISDSLRNRLFNKGLSSDELKGL